MKKILALLLALIMCVGVFAACGEEKEPAAKDPVDTPADKPEDKPTEPTDKPEDKPSEPTTDPNAPPVPEGYTRTKVTFDMTDTYTLVIKTVSAAGSLREGIRCEPGKVAAGKYNPVGRRTVDFPFNWSDFGLEGRPWEYLGSEFEIDVKDFEEKELKNTVYQIATKPVKSAWCVKASDITFPNDKTLKTPDGTEFDLSIMNYGALRNNLLFNEGGQYIPLWNWVKNCNSPTDPVFIKSPYCDYYYFLIKIPQFGKNFITDVTNDMHVNDGLPDVSVIPTAHAGAIGTEYVVVANDKRSLGTGEACFRNAIRVVLKESYDAYVAGTAKEHEMMTLNYTDTADNFIGTVLLVDYNTVEEKLMGVYLTGEKIG